MSKVIKFGKKIGGYPCFSNFYSCNVTYEGITYKSSEAAWQALKVLDMQERKSFALLSASEAKKKGRKVTLRSDWEDVKFDLMVEVCYAKFKQNPNLARQLLSTEDAVLVEDTTGWHDNLWGNCDCPKCINIEGKNLLGKALMEVREKLKLERGGQNFENR